MPKEANSQTGSPKETEDEKNKYAEEQGRITEFLNEIVNVTDAFSAKSRELNKTLDKYYYGIQWNRDDGVTMDKSHQILLTGELAWYFEDETNDKFDTDTTLPQRVINNIFPFVETQTELLRKANITLSALPPNMYADDKSKQKETARIISLVFQTVFGKEFQSEMEKCYREIAKHDHAFLYLDYDKEKENKGEIPFFVRYEKAEGICGDPEAETWQRNCWTVRKYKLRKFWIVKRYPKSAKMDVIKNRKQLDIIDLQEVIVRQDLVYPENGSPDMWVKFVRIGNTVLQESVLPILPIECFRTYQTDGWWGISEVKMVKPHQDAINKVQSQADYNRMLLALPPMQVSSSIEVKQGEMFIKPGMTVPMQYNGNPPVLPIQVVQMNPDGVTSAIKNEERYSENITGVQKIMQGQNDTGVYSGSHAKILQDSGMMRLDGKLQPIKDSLIYLGKKLLKGLNDIIIGGIKIEIYDPINNKIIPLTKEMFTDYEKYDIITETTDANMLSPIERIEYLKELMKYGSIDSKNFLIPLNNIMPGLLDKDIVETMKDQLLLQNDLEMRKLVLAQKELELNGAKMDVEMANIQNPPPPPEQPVPDVTQPPVPQQEEVLPQEPQMQNGEAILQEFITQQLELLLSNGIVKTTEEGEAFIRQELDIARQSNPNATPQQLVEMVREEIENGGI